jgi:3-hydroxyisobutyrate dehydrogenase-like beta-hydroxyacid dehydrogenase
MGYLMARNLANHNATHPGGFQPLLVWNRSKDKAESLVKIVGADKARVAKDLDEIVQACDIILTSLANDTVVKSVYEQFAKTLKDHPPSKNKTFVEMSTVYPTLAGELDKLISSNANTHLVTCPVIGPPIAADKAQLLLLMSGDYRSKKEAAYVLVPAIGRRVVDLGGDLQKGPTLKLIANSMIIGNLEILAETFTLASKAGISSEGVVDIVQEFFPAPIVMNYANRMATGQFDGSNGFSVDNGIKDATHIHRLSADHNSPMPITDIAYQHLLTARAVHRNDSLKQQANFETLDWSGLIAGTRLAAGLSAFDRAEDTAVERED